MPGFSFNHQPHRRTATVPRFFDFQLSHQVCFEHLTDNFSDTGRSQLRQTGKIDTRDWTKLINQAINRARVGLLYLINVPRLVFSNHRILPIFSRSEIICRLW
ncbi:Uncharacterised protein [Shigella flexneri]|nr:Uncharacterised protein [Shigella flexneri]